MTIRIIKQGIDVDSVTYRETCSFCRTEVEFEGRDARNEINFLYRAKVIDCPVCMTRIQANLGAPFMEDIPDEATLPA